MKKIFLLGFLSLLTFSYYAQDDIKEIRDYYSELKQSMKETEEHSNEYEYVQYYVLKIEENIHGMSMPAVGNYSGTTEKWYTPDEEHYGVDGNLVYKKSSFEIAARSEFSEYVFKDGKLIFCFISSAGTEYRYYFKNNQLIKFLEKDDDDFAFHSEGDWVYLLEHAED